MAALSHIGAGPVVDQRAITGSLTATHFFYTERSVDSGENQVFGCSFHLKKANSLLSSHPSKVPEALNMCINMF